MPLPTAKITKTPHPAGQYVVTFRDYDRTPLNERLYAPAYFTTRQAAVQHVNNRILDAMGVF